MNHSIRLPVLFFSLSLHSMDIIRKWYNYTQATSKKINKKYQLFLNETLIVAIQKDQKFSAIFELLIMLGADVNARYCFSTILTKAAYHNNLPAVKVLLRNGADANGIPFYGVPFDGAPLAMAINHNNDKMVELLVQYGANIDRHFPLHHTALRGVYHTTLTLLAQGAAIDDPAPLIQAIFQATFVGGYEERKKIAKALLYAGMNPHKKSIIEKCAPIEFINFKHFRPMLENHFTIAKFCSPEELADLNRVMESRSNALIKKECNTAYKGSSFRQQQYRELTGRFP